MTDVDYYQQETRKLREALNALRHANEILEASLDTKLAEDRCDGSGLRGAEVSWSRVEYAP